MTSNRKGSIIRTFRALHRDLTWLSAAVILLCVTLLSSNLHAQTTGTIFGQVTDPSGAVVASGTTTATNTGTSLVRTGTINSDGTYLIPSLPIGSYKLTVESPSFKQFSQTGITLQVGQNARVDVALQPGSVSESVNVSGAALSVDTQSTTVGGAIDNRRIEDIPLNGRNVLALAQLLPGVGQSYLPTVVTFSRAGPVFTVSGSRQNANNVQLDGTTLVGAMGNVAQNLPSPDSLQEFRILTNTYSAEYGRASGAVLLAVTKSGTNNFHGGLWEFLRNDALNARNYFNGTGAKPYLRQNQFGFSFGGPVILPHYNGKGKTFFFVSYQGLRIRQQLDDVSTPPTAAELAGDFSGQAPIIDPDTGLPFPGNIIPTNRLDPLAQTMTSLYLPVNPGLGSLQQLISQPTNTNQLSVKLDQKLSNADNLSFRYYWDKDVTLNTRGGDAIPLEGSESNKVTSYSVYETHIFSPKLLNEAHFSFTEPDSLFVASKNNKTPTELGAMFAQDGPVPLAPNVTVNGFFGIFPEFPLPEPDKEFQIDEKLSWIKGRHAMRFGVQYMHIHHLSEGQFNSSGGFTFDGSFTGNPLADYILGRPVDLFQQSPLHDESVTANYQFFAQDDFKVSRRLTLNLGLRYELDTPPVQVLNWTSSIRPFVGCTVATCQQSKLFPTAPPGLVFPGDPGVPRGLVPADKTNFGPRIGFAYDLFGNGRTAIRGAYALFYDYTGAIVSATVNQTLPYVVPIDLPSPPSFTDPYRGRTDPFPLKLDLSNPQFVYPTQAYSVGPNFKNGRVHEFNLNIQQQLGSDWFVQVGYYGKLGRNLSDDHEGNPAIFGPGATEANVQSRRAFFPQFYGSIGLITSDANSSYHSLQASMDKKFSHDFTLQLAYTYSKSIDNRSTFSVDGTSGANPFNYLAGERGLSDFDQRHILAINGIWDLPFLKSNGWLTTAFGGWQLAGTTRYGSGFPFSVVSAQDYALEGSGRGTAQERPNQVGDPNLPSGRSRTAQVAEYFNTGAFAAPNLGEYGTLRRNTLIGPHLIQTDLAFIKQFKVPKENWGRFEFRGEIFNLFNNVNFNGRRYFWFITFEQLQSAQDGRIVQLGLRYDF